jgi:AraC family transcriptional regulator, regulatory protein of adaptative response / methylated-DNA-[protein]-cysteine methyltransferase
MMNAGAPLQRATSSMNKALSMACKQRGYFANPPALHYCNALEATMAGFRACVRCKPLAQLDHQTQKMSEICRFIQANLEGDISLKTLARQAGLSPSHLQRRFKAKIGLSPADYAQALRLAQLKQELRQATSVTHAIYAAGFSTASRVYEQIDSALGMTPGAYRRGGAGLSIHYTVCATILGWILLAATKRGICAVFFGSSAEALKADLTREFPHAVLTPCLQDNPETAAQLQGWLEMLVQHLAQGGPALDVPLDIQGTVFERKVWAFLQSIPAGEQRSYQQVAQAIGAPKAARAVGRACGANRLAVLIPCHRVLRADGALGGYRWGLARKQALLEREHANPLLQAEPDQPSARQPISRR